MRWRWRNSAELDRQAEEVMEREAAQHARERAALGAGSYEMDAEGRFYWQPADSGGADGP